MVNLLSIVLTYQNVYGEDKSYKDAVELIAKYSVGDAILNISRIGVGLVSVNNIKGVNPLENQIQLLGKLVSKPKGYRIVKALQSIMKEEGQRGTIRNFIKTVGIFSSVQVIAAAKLALCNCTGLNNREPIDKIQDDLVDAFLIINHIMGPFLRGKPNLAQMLAMNQQFLILEEPYHYFYRWKLLVEKMFHIAEKEKFASLKLREKYISSFKREPGSYGQIGSILFGIWELIPIEVVDKGEYIMSENIVKKMTKFSDDEFHRIIAEFCGTPQFFKENISTEEEKNPWLNKILRQKPIVKIDDRLICIDRNLIAMKVGEGLYYSLINLYNDETEEGRNYRNMVSSILGYAFQEYADETLDRIFLSKEVKRTRRRFIRGDDIPQDKKEKRMVDGIIDYGTALIIIECKSSLLPLKAKESCKEDGKKAWSDWLERTIYSGADQIDKVIKQIKNGELDGSLKINHNEIKDYYPLIICLEQLPNASPDFLFEIEEELSSRGIFSDKLHIKKLEVMHIANLENAEILINRGVAFKRLLYTKIKKAHFNDWNSFFNEEYPNVDFSGKNTDFGKKRIAAMQKEMTEVFNREEIEKMKLKAGRKGGKE